MLTVDEEGNCLDGTTAEDAATMLTAWGVDALGCNCSSGPAVVLGAIERMHAVTPLPLAAMPNAGMPRSVDGRNIYLTSPEYLASFAKKFVKAGGIVHRRLLRDDAEIISVRYARRCGRLRPSKRRCRSSPMQCPGLRKTKTKSSRRRLGSDRRLAR